MGNHDKNGILGGQPAGVNSVAIVGAGVAGLQTAKILLEIGIECTIFEKSKDIGGVWRENYADFGLQVPKELYEFPGYPYPQDEHWDLFPDGPQVQRYIHRYAQEFGLLKLVRFGSPVTGFKKVEAGNGGWMVSFEDPSRGKSCQHFDFLVISTGMYTSPPHMPVAHGAEEFNGAILHSSAFIKNDESKGKRVVVVGGGKSAVDCAVSAAKSGLTCTFLCREAHWPVPRYLLNLVPFKWGTYSRFGHFMLPASHEESGLSSLFHRVLSPVKWLFWRTVEMMFMVQFRLTGDQVPTTRIEHDLFGGGLILTYEYRDLLRSGRIQCIKGSIDHFTNDSVVLQDSTEVKADMVIYATGFKKNYTLFDGAVRENLDVQDDGLYLYRNIIPPSVPDLAFIGSEVATFNNILTHGLQALWLQRWLSGRMILPPTLEMQRSIAGEQMWKLSWMRASGTRAATWQLHMMKYHDNLCEEMGIPKRRKGFNFLAEIFAPYSAFDYASLFAKRVATF